MRAQQVTTAFIFPGQGSQSVGMGKALAEMSPAARAVFEQVDDALQQNLTRLMFEGPEDQLTLTANAQPAIMASSLAALAVLETEGGIRLAEKAAFVAGHSLGEYSALSAAGAMPLDVTAKLLRRRGEAMQAAVPPGEGAMAAILGLGLEDVQAIAAEALASAVRRLRYAVRVEQNQIALGDDHLSLVKDCARLEAQQPVANGIDLSRVNFRYEVSGDRAPWRPLRAFDDGRQVFIEFPRGIGQGEMPPLFVVGPEGATSELVNYRVRGNYMIVDRLFAAAELRFGADKNQKRVRISRTDGRPAS